MDHIGIRAKLEYTGKDIWYQGVQVQEQLEKDKLVSGILRDSNAF